MSGGANVVCRSGQRTYYATIVAMLEETPPLEAKTIFEQLVAKTPGRYQDGQLRTLQRHIRRWRASSGPEREVFFP